jgi:hypothetical protein
VGQAGKQAFERRTSVYRMLSNPCPDLLVVAASIVVLAVGSNGKVVADQIFM